MMGLDKTLHYITEIERVKVFFHLRYKVHAVGDGHRKFRLYKAGDEVALCLCL